MTNVYTEMDVICRYGKDDHGHMLVGLVWFGRADILGGIGSIKVDTKRANLVFLQYHLHNFDFIVLGEISTRMYVLMTTLHCYPACSS